MPRRCVWLLAGLLGATMISSPALPTSQENEQASQENEEWVCPPCGHDCLKSVFSESGACGECGMQRVLLAEVINQPTPQHAEAQTDRKKVAVLIFDGVEIIDYTGPWEIFGQAGYQVFAVAKSKSVITTTFGMKVTPDHTFDDHPVPDVVLVPGGQVIATQRDVDVQTWLQANAGGADVVLSVCNGAFILAKAGLLEGLSATTTRPLIDGLANAGRDITVVRDVRFVDNGKIVTSGGLSAGMDAALHVVSRLEGKAIAKQIADSIEYDWRSEQPAPSGR